MAYVDHGKLLVFPPLCFFVSFVVKGLDFSCSAVIRVDPRSVLFFPPLHPLPLKGFDFLITRDDGDLYPPPPIPIPDWRAFEQPHPKVIPDWRRLQQSGLDWRGVESFWGCFSG
jgi:hypothetical protein